MPDTPHPTQSSAADGGEARGWTPAAPEEIARLLPNYDVLSILGRGGMGAVYLAVQTALDREVAIKLLPLEVSADPDFADRFVREARAMAKLNHPHIVSVYDFGKTSEGHLYIVMEYVDGANLDTMIHGAGLAPAQAPHIAAQVCEALAYAHAQGVVHREIKPANVMVDQNGQAKIADFGLARLTDLTAEHLGTTGTGTIIGTADCMAPEQRKGMQVDHRADIYSLGVMIYEMLCGEVPRGAFAPPSHRVECDVRVDHFVKRAMQQEPALRYQSTQEMKTDVDAARTPLEKPERGPRNAESKTSRTRAAGIVAVGLVLASAAGFVFWKKAHQPDAAEPSSSTFQSRGEAPGSPASLDFGKSGSSKDAPFVNTLGMKFVPVPILGGQRVLFSVWDTRVQDYEVFVQETGREWPKADFPQEPVHPAVNVSWDDALLFCQWLTAREQAAGRLGTHERYRLPSDHE
jgi:serine/threonine protein kinase